ncbi:hypothetical protein ACSQ67_000971 [Phaseolus vulgaris]
MVMTEEKCASCNHSGDPTPGSPKDVANFTAPIEAIPLAMVRAASPQAPLGGNEGVVHIESDEEEEFVGVLPSRGGRRPGWPPPTLLPPAPGGTQGEPLGPPLLYLILLSRRRWGLRESPLPQPPPNSPASFNTSRGVGGEAKARSLVTEDAPIESVFYGLGSYLAQKHDHREQATKEKPAMADEVAKPKEVLGPTSSRGLPCRDLPTHFRWGCGEAREDEVARMSRVFGTECDAYVSIRPWAKGELRVH